VVLRAALLQARCRGIGLIFLSDSICHVARGGVYTWSASKSWTSLGAYQLGLSWLGIGGNGDYGLETIALTNTIGGVSTVAVDNALIAGINVTGFYQGLLGIGATSGNFSNKIANPYISQLASTYGQIPSHSYGFTAGAYYGKYMLWFTTSLKRRRHR
jgi:hypothetical protein